MTSEGLRKVSDAEDKAEDVIDLAQEEADRMLADARLEASRKIRDTGKRAEAEGNRIREKLLREGLEEAADIERGADERCREIRKRATSRMDEAVSVVAESFR